MDSSPKMAKWATQNGLYMPRLNFHNTGSTWIAYREAFMNPERQPLTIEDHIHACTIPLPVDVPEAMEAITHQYSSFSLITSLAMRDLGNAALSQAVMGMVEARLFQYTEDFNLAIAGCTDAQTYKDDSWPALVKFYAFLSYVTDIKTPCALYSHLNSRFTIRVLIPRRI